MSTNYGNISAYFCIMTKQFEAAFTYLSSAISFLRI